MFYEFEFYSFAQKIEAKFRDSFLEKSGGREAYVKRNRFLKGIEKPLACTFSDETSLDPCKAPFLTDSLHLHDSSVYFT